MNIKILGLAVALTVVVGLVLSGCGRDPVNGGFLGASCSTASDCAFGFVCLGEVCRPMDDVDGGIPCDNPGTSECVDSRTRIVCTEEGQVRTQSCEPGICAEGECNQDRVCEDGERICRDNNPTACIDGQWVEEDACPRGFVCRRGECRERGANNRPDIVPTFLFISPERASLFEDLFLQLEVANFGEAPMTRGVACEITAGNIFVGRVTVDPLGVGEFQFLDAFLPGGLLPPGRYETRVDCDPNDVVEESNENNNTISGNPILVFDGEGEVDLVVSFYQLFVDVLFPDEPVFGEFAVFNGGRQPIAGFECSFFLAQGDGVPRPGQDPFMGSQFQEFFLEPGQEVFLEAFDLFTPFVPQGVYVPYVVCEPFAPDFFFDNNFGFSFPIEVVGGERPNLTVVEGFFEPNVIDEGGTFQVFATVCNEGEGFVEFAELGVFAEAPNGQERELSRLAVDSMGPFECTEVIDFAGPAQCFAGDSYLVSFVVDPNNFIAETNENDNRWFVGPELQVVGPNCAPCEGDECGCEGDFWDPENPDNPPVLPPPDELLTLCPFDTDIFTVPTSMGANLRIEFLPFVMDASAFVTLIGRNGNAEALITQREFFGPGTFEVFNLPPANQYILRLESFLDTSFPYSLNVTSIGEGDVDLVADNLNVFSATRVGETINVQYRVRNLGPTGSGAHFDTLYLVPGNTDIPPLRIFLTEQQNNSVPGGGQRIRNLLGVVPDDLTPGEYTVVVVTDNAGQIDEIREDNNTAVAVIDLSGPLMCEDAFEPNDDMASATDLAAGEYDNLFVCTDSDFYRFCVEGDSFSFFIAFDHDETDVDLRVFDEGGDIVGSSTSVSDNEEVALNNLEPGACFFADVHNFNGSGGAAYSIVLDLGEASCSSVFEPNNTFAQAPDVFGVINQTLDFCPQGDVDFYAIDLGAGEEVTIVASPLPGEPAGDISLTLFDPTMSFVTQRFSRQVTLDFMATDAGTYYLRLVTSSGSDLFRYEIAIAQP